MRITRVTLAFFSVGFLAGTFERAAGLGDVPPAPRASAFVADVPPSVVGEISSVPRVRGGPRAPAAVELVRQEPAPREPDVAEATAAAAAAAAAHSIDEAVDASDSPSHPDLSVYIPALAAKRRMSLLSRSSRSPMPEPAFVSLPPRDGNLMPEVPASEVVETLRPGREPSAAGVPPEFILPFEKGRITSLFNQGRRHPAIDLAGPLGTPVHATTPKQRVTFTGWRGGYGYLVITRDPSGRQHYYGHLQRIAARVGTALDQGQTLGRLGSTGRSTGPHVHYEVRTPAGRHLDPAGLLFPGLRVARGYSWNGSRSIRVAARTDQPRPR